MSLFKAKCAALAVLVGFALGSCTSSRAANVAETDGAHGELLLLTDEVGHCVEGAKLAKWIGKGRNGMIPGCWVVIEGGLQVAYADGSAQRYPVRLFRKPREI